MRSDKLYVKLLSPFQHANEFLDGAFHTAYLDDVLAARSGTPFVESSPTTEDVAVIAAALHAVLSPASLSSSASGTNVRK